MSLTIYGDIIVISARPGNQLQPNTTPDISAWISPDSYELEDNMRDTM